MTNNRKINSLTTIKSINAEMRSVYRQARLNIPDKEIDPATAKALTDILKTITAAHRDSELEQRMNELEQALK